MYLRYQKTVLVKLSVWLLMLPIAALIGCGGRGLAGTTGTTQPPSMSPEFLYVANHGSNNVSGFTINTVTGVLSPVAGSPFSAEAGPNAAVIAFGKFLYVANSTSNDVSAYAIDQSNGTLTPVTGSPFAAGTGPQ